MSTPPPPCHPPFKKTCRCTIHPPLFKNFQISPPLGDVIKIYSHPPLIKVNDGLIDLDRDAKVVLGFLEEKLKTLIYIHFSPFLKFSDQIQNCPIQFKKLKDWTLTFQKIGQNFKSCLKSTVMIEANSWKNRRKILQQSQRNRVV